MRLKPMRPRPPFVVDHPDDAADAPRRDRALQCSIDARPTARAVEAILRESFSFPDHLSERVRQAAELIATDILAASNRLDGLFYGEPQGNA